MIGPVITILFLGALIAMVIPSPILGLIGRLLFSLGALGVFVSMLGKSLVIKKYEALWFVFFLLFSITGLLSAALSVRPEAGYLDFGRQIFMLVITLAMILHFRVETNFNRFRLMLLYPAVLGSIVIIVGFIAIMGVPTYDSLSELSRFKYEMDGQYGVNPNPLSFAILLLGILSWRGRFFAQAIWYRLCLILIGLAVFLSGARTTVVVLIIGLGLYRVFCRGWGFGKLLLLFTSLVFLSVVFYWGFKEYEIEAILYLLSDLTTGRSELWAAAISKFHVRPILGWGAGTWDIDLPNYLALYSSDMARFDELSSGAFHNAYLTLLAEKGLVGFFIGVWILGFLVHLSFKVCPTSSSAKLVKSNVYFIYPLFFLIVMIRGLSESGGVFGYANGLIDFVVYSGVCLLIAFADNSNKWASS